MPRREAAGVLLANEIEQRIRASMLPPGCVFASEQDLQSGSEAGRSVVRQAVRLLEQRGVAHMKRGVGGGLIVRAPDVGAAARNLSIVIERDIQDFSALEALNRATEAFLLLDSVRNLGLEKADALRQLARSLGELSTEAFVEAHGHRQMVIALFEALGDPAANLFRRTAMECGLDLVPWEVNEAAEMLRGEFWELTLARVEALIAGDVPKLFAIREAQARFYDSSAEWRDMERTSQVSAEVQAKPRSGLKAERLAREILREIRLRGWVTGERLGSFEDLEARHGASSSVLREAIRMLEENSAVQMQRGRSGGLVIAAPDRRKAVSGALHYLRAVGATKLSVVRHLDQILMEAIERAAQSASPAALEVWKADILTPALATGEIHGGLQQIYTGISALSGNIALTIVAEILSNLAWPDSGSKAAAPARELAELELMIDCIAARDPAKARRAYLVHRSRLSTIDP